MHPPSQVEADGGDYKEIPSRLIEGEEEAPPVPDCRNLEEKIPEFVLETKRISIPGFPDAFNPSIIQWKGRLLMCFRAYHPLTRTTNEIGLVYLNEEFEPEGEPKFLKFLSPDPYCLAKRQDPRLIEVNGNLHIVYNNAIEGEVRRMLVARIDQRGDDFFVDSSDCMIDFEGQREVRSEKNWVPFAFENQLYLSYSLVPHKVFFPRIGENRCELAFLSLSAFKWNWGVLRGGTPALLIGDEYLAFFHCSKSMATQHSKCKSIPHYFMGAYTFSAKPPFHLTRISPEPIVGKNFYKGPAYKTWKPLRVVFPGGFVSDDRFIWIVYGRQDHESWMVKLDKKQLLDSLIPLPPP